MRSQGICYGSLVEETRNYVTSLRTIAIALLRLVRNRSSIDNSWHWVLEVILRESGHLYREINGIQFIASLRSMAINALRLNGIWSVIEVAPL